MRIRLDSIKNNMALLKILGFLDLGTYRDSMMLPEVYHRFALNISNRYMEQGTRHPYKAKLTYLIYS